MSKKPVYAALPFSFLKLMLVLFLFSAPGACPASADIFKYVDDDGVIHFSNVPEARKCEKVVKEKAPALTAKAGPVYTQAGKPKAVSVSPQGSMEPLADHVPYSGLINTKCDKYGVDPQLVRAIIKAESNFNPFAVSPKGARGLMQLMPSTASDMDVKDCFDPEQNIDGGVRYFRYLLDNFGGDVELSVAAYNCGQGKVIRNGNTVPNISETKNYVKKVLRLSNNPITGMTFTRPIYKIELKDGSIMFTDSPSTSGGSLSIVD